MKEQIQAKFDEDGVSPVIGVILMVAVTVALVALVTVIVFDIGGDVSESPDATVDLEVDDGDDVIRATVLRNENVEGFEIVDADGNADSSGQVSLSSGAGSSNTLAFTSATLPVSGTAQVVANMSDGSRQVLTTTDYQITS